MRRILFITLFVLGCVGCVKSVTQNSSGCTITIDCSDGGKLTCGGEACTYAPDDPMGAGHVTCDGTKTACNQRR